MTERSFVWEAGGGGDESPHSVSAWGAVEAAIAGVASANEGVLPRMLNELAPSTQAGATQIRIASGWAIVDGHPYHNDGNEDFTPVTPSSGTTGRRAVLRADWSAQTVRIVEISSADGTSTIPGLTQTSGTTYEIPLCQYTVTTGGAIGSFVDEREFAGAWTLSEAAAQLVEAGIHKGFWGLGAPTGGSHTYATNDLVGMGCQVREGTSGIVQADTDAADGCTWAQATGTTSGSDAGFIGPRLAAANDWTMVWRGVLPTNAALTVALIGAFGSEAFADSSNTIAIRVLTTGEIVGVCDSGGTETTRASGVTPDGTTEHSARIEVREGGTIVRFYLDNAQIGADVTTNIPTGLLYAVCGLRNNTTTSVVMNTADWFGWREA